MTRAWQLGLTGSFMVHLAMLLGYYMLPGYTARPAEHPPLEITLVAAPAPVFTPPVIRPEPTPAPPRPQATPSPALKPEVPAVTLALKITPTGNLPAAPAVASLAPPAKTLAAGDSAAHPPVHTLATPPAPTLICATPDYLKNPEPPYPPLARRRHQAGLVLVSVSVNPAGRATRVALKVSSGFPILDAAALEAVRDWEFKPARIGNLTTSSEIEVPVRFQLTD